MNAIVRQGLATGAGVVLALCVGATAFGQDPAPAANTPAQPQPTIQMVQAEALLDHSLDAKKAKQGDAVTAKLAQNVQVSDQQALPKNTVLEGHVDQVQPSEHKSDSMMVVTFDKAKLKDGQELPIKVTIIAVSEPAFMQQQGGAPASEGAPMPSGAPTGGGSPGGSSPGGSSPGGSGGSMAGSSPSGPGPGAQPMNVPQGNSSSRQQAQRNGVPDVVLASDIHQHTSATFTSKGKNVHVPDGTQMRVAIAIIPSGVKLQ